MTKNPRSARRVTAASVGALLAWTGGAMADQVIAQDLIVQGSLCTGTDCINNEAFGFDTIILKENNLRIFFNDTSNSGSFPSNDWRIVANDSVNGGASYLSIQDATVGRDVFRVEAGAPSNTLYVESDGDVGIKTANPVVDLHIVEGNTPTLRLEQDGSDGFTPQTWDIAANETNFFVRDVTHSSKLPFRIEPNTPENTLYLDNGGLVGIGTNLPAAPVHILRRTGAFAPMLELENNGPVALIMDNNDASNAVEWRLGQIPGSTDLVIVTPDSAGDEFKLTTSGDLRILGNFISNGQTLTVPDYVFDAEYTLRPLTEVRAFIDANSHLPDVPSAADIAQNGVNLSAMQMTLLRKIEELTLYTLAQEERIGALSAEVQRLSR